MVSGSGPTVFGLFAGAEGIAHAQAAAAAPAAAPPARRRGAGRRAFAAPVARVRPAWIAGAVAIALYLVAAPPRARARVPGAGALAAAGAALIGFGVIELPNFEHLIEEAGEALGKWTYLSSGCSRSSRPARSSA